MYDMGPTTAAWKHSNMVIELEKPSRNNAVTQCYMHIHGRHNALTFCFLSISALVG